MKNPQERLKFARERLNKSPREVALAAGINESSYYDLEAYDDEIDLGISLAMLKKVCDVLGIQALDLFLNNTEMAPGRIPTGVLADSVRDYIAKSRMTISEFEDKADFRIGHCLENPDSILEWNIDCLCSICKELGIDWRYALP